MEPMMTKPQDLIKRGWTTLLYEVTHDEEHWLIVSSKNNLMLGCFFNDEYYLHSRTFGKGYRVWEEPNRREAPSDILTIFKLMVM